MSLEESIQAILKFAIQKDGFTRVGKLAEVIARDKFAISEFNVTIVLAEYEEITGGLFSSKCTMNECDVSIASYTE